MNLGELEEKILLAILQLQNNTYGALVRQALEDAGRKVSIGALYVTLDRLETKGLIVGRDDEVPSSRGGRVRRYFQVTGAGYDALRRDQDVRAKLGGNLPFLANLGGKTMGGAA